MLKVEIYLESEIFIYLDIISYLDLKWWLGLILDSPPPIQSWSPSYGRFQRTSLHPAFSSRNGSPQGLLVGCYKNFSNLIICFQIRNFFWTLSPYSIDQVRLWKKVKSMLLAKRLVEV